jgi:L-threonylcarbamoyladenylate synthase
VHPDPTLIETAAGLIRKGGVVVYPTSSLYGLGADAFHPKAVNRIFDIKGRSRQKPILLLIGHRKEAETLVRDIPPLGALLMEHFWPGSLTLVFSAGKHLNPDLTAETGKIGIRLCSHPVALALVRAVGRPITGTSANLSEKEGCFSIACLDKQIGNQADLILDAGKLKGGSGSTVVDVSSGYPVILREGEIPSSTIRTVIENSAIVLTERPDSII